MLARRECVLVRVFDFLEAFPPATPHANESAGEAECGKANASAGSFSQCHLLMTLSIRCLITPSASHMAGVTPTPRLCRHPCVRACRLFSSNNAFLLPVNAFKCSLVKKGGVVADTLELFFCRTEATCRTSFLFCPY